MKLSKRRKKIMLSAECINQGKYVFTNFRLRMGILLIIIGLAWFGKIGGLFASELFGPLVMLIIGIWFIIVYFINRIIIKYNNWISCLDLKQGDFIGL